MDDYYALLGVGAGATVAELRRAWRRLALRWHPDRAGAEATATFQSLQGAYAVLSDPAARAAYDRRRGTAPTTIAPRRSAPSTVLHRLSGPLASLLACGIARRVSPEVIELLLSREEAANGGMATISMQVPVNRPTGVAHELFSAWLAIPPGVADGAELAPSALLPGMLHPVSFRVRLDEETAP